MPEQLPTSVSRWSRHAVEFSPDGVLVVSSEGTIEYANRSIEHMVGGDRSLVGTCVDDLGPGGLRERHARLRTSFFDAPTQRPMGSGLELGLQCADGSELPVEVALSPFDDEGLYAVAAVRDVTERRRNQRRLAHANQQLTLLEERERIGRDLHDVVLQRLYGTGLTVQAIGAGADQATQDALESVIDEIDRIIGEVRTIVFTLGNSGQRGSLGQDLADVVAQASRLLGFTPALRLVGPVESVMSDETSAEMMASLREALGNVARHAEASAVEVTIAVADDRVTMQVRDDGVGPPDLVGRPTSGNGLVNLEARASALGGNCSLGPATPTGALLSWSVPY